jgi:hypothetical protein
VRPPTAAPLATARGTPWWTGVTKTATGKSQRYPITTHRRPTIHHLLHHASLLGGGRWVGASLIIATNPRTRSGINGYTRGCTGGLLATSPSPSPSPSTASASSSTRRRWTTHGLGQHERGTHHHLLGGHVPHGADRDAGGRRRQSQGLGHSLDGTSVKTTSNRSQQHPPPPRACDGVMSNARKALLPYRDDVFEACGVVLARGEAVGVDGGHGVGPRRAKGPNEAVWGARHAVVQGQGDQRAWERGGKRA